MFLGIHVAMKAFYGLLDLFADHFVRRLGCADARKVIIIVILVFNMSLLFIGQITLL